MRLLSERKPSRSKLTLLPLIPLLYFLHFLHILLCNNFLGFFSCVCVLRDLGSDSARCNGWHNGCWEEQVRTRWEQRYCTDAFFLYGVFFLPFLLNLFPTSQLSFTAPSLLDCGADTDTDADNRTDTILVLCYVMSGQMQASCYSIRFGGGLFGAVVGNVT